MKKIELPKSLSKRITFHSSYCDLHTVRRGKEDVAFPVQKMELDGKVICPRCESEREQKEFEKKVNDEIFESVRMKNRNVFKNKSLLTDQTISTATIDNFLAKQQEEVKNKNLTISAIDDYKNGQTFNLIFQGEPGSGKSHLSYSLLRILNESDNLDTSCLFISIEDMLRKIKSSFNDKESKYTESYFTELLSDVDYLVLDDLGAETGAIESDKSATDFVQRVLYGVMNSRQNKSTIITMNLDGKQLRKRYDSKLISRLLRNPRYIIFKETNDKRMINTPF